MLYIIGHAAFAAVAIAVLGGGPMLLIFRKDLKEWWKWRRNR